MWTHPGFHGGIPLPHWQLIEWLTFVIGVGTLASAFLIGFTALLARGALRDAARTRHGELVISLNEQWVSPTIKESVGKFAELSDQDVEGLIGRLFDPNGPPADDGDAETYESLQAAADHVEMIGVLLFEGAMGPEVLYNAWGGVIMELWKGWHLGVVRFRDLYDQPEVYRYFELAALAMRAIDTERRAARQRVVTS